MLPAEIIRHLEDPAQLEKMYRQNKSAFRKAFSQAYPDIKDTLAARIWQERLQFGQEGISWGSRYELLFVLALAFLAGLVAKIPDFTGISPDYFFPRNIAFVAFPFLAAFFAWKQKVASGMILTVSASYLLAAMYINVLPDDPNSDTLILACIHLPLFLWALLGTTFAGGLQHPYQKRIEFLRYNGDLLVMSAIMVIAGGLFTGITIGLFKLIDLRIEDFYFKYVGIWGAATIPLAATWLVRTNPQLVSKVAPVIARVFTPVVLVTLVIYLGAVVYTGKDPYNDREFLLLFNGMLIGVMALILFSIAETVKQADGRVAPLLLFALSVVTILVNGVALSAILFRIAGWGITPNRLAVLGSNILILTNLVQVAYRLYRTLKDPQQAGLVEKSIATFLPIYTVWTMIVVFLFPLLFGFR